MTPQPRGADAPDPSHAWRRYLVLALLTLPVMALTLALAGCSAEHAVVGERGVPAVRAQGPYQRWAERPPAEPDRDAAKSGERTAGVPVAGFPDAEGGLHAVDPMELVTADLPAGPDHRGDPGERERLVAELGRCERPGAAGCPLESAHYRDLTGNGEDELILGVGVSPDILNIRIYACRDGRVLRIMNTYERVLSVELAQRDVIVRSHEGAVGTEKREVWTWCPSHQALLPRLTEIIRPAGKPHP
ncbi:hypothetical protein OHS33_15675 [Streptomyces sp. NBC_00536]|uniref:hypothetical protein n=1 Tax=Streptomyces sp. NBC_00536 TaxID=2975769 RepID=UPI002E80EFCB|nr:hypothetical protein [Streptomyces sp. NBC_00536]WUC79639.1 hypothetical protein OHS33_15675 [Streptomyces sp. NBC_00536]